MSWNIYTKYALYYESEENGGCAKWNEDIEEWTLRSLHLSGNALRMKRETSIDGLPRPETNFAREMKKDNNFRTNPRYKYKNVIDLELENNFGDGDEYIDLKQGYKKRIEDLLNFSVLSSCSQDKKSCASKLQTSNINNPYFCYDKKASKGDDLAVSKILFHENLFSNLSSNG